ncbi:MAG: hypothetical protein CM1200mP41_38580 [Gammaproteobacteria bacterium]|nr:MAG: hypothetical protein CM1200mP41_38580 [Gammaproteobacteria bacterium]
MVLRHLKKWRPAVGYYLAILSITIPQQILGDFCSVCLTRLGRNGTTRPVIRALKSRVIQVQEHAAGTQLGIGYGKPINSRSLIRTAVIPIGLAMA